jgi:hypothetical protein
MDVDGLTAAILRKNLHFGVFLLVMTSIGDDWQSWQAQ